jgi:hypothetical protein
MTDRTGKKTDRHLPALGVSGAGVRSRPIGTWASLERGSSPGPESPRRTKRKGRSKWLDEKHDDSSALKRPTAVRSGSKVVNRGGS